MPILQAARSAAGYFWDSVRRLFVSEETGRPVPPRDVRGALDQVLDAGKDRLADLAGQLRDGEIETGDWQDKVRDELTSLHLAAKLAAVGGIEQLDDADVAAVGETLGEQLDYLDGFAAEIESGAVDLDSDGFQARAGSYADAARSETYEGTVLEGQKEAGAGFARRTLDPAADHCADCLDLAGQGWVPIDDLTPIGECQCGSRCRCEVSYRDEAPEGDGTEGEEDFSLPCPVITEAVVFSDGAGHWVTINGAHVFLADPGDLERHEKLVAQPTAKLWRADNRARSEVHDRDNWLARATTPERIAEIQAGRRKALDRLGAVERALADPRKATDETADFGPATRGRALLVDYSHLDPREAGQTRAMLRSLPRAENLHVPGHVEVHVVPKGMSPGDATLHHADLASLAIPGFKPGMHSLSDASGLEELYGRLTTPEVHDPAKYSRSHEGYPSYRQATPEHWIVQHPDQIHFQLVHRSEVPAGLKPGAGHHEARKARGEVRFTATVEFFDPDQPRDERGRWTSGGTGHLEAARGHIADIQASRGGTTPDKIRALHDTLTKLTVAQLKQIKQEYGLKASGPRKAELVAKVHARLLSGHGSGPPAAAVGQQAPARRTVPPLSQIARANPLPEATARGATVRSAQPDRSRKTPAPEKLGPSKAKVEVQRFSDPAEVQRRIRGLLGPHATPEHMASIVGAPDNATVVLDTNIDPGALSVGFYGPGYSASRTVARNARGETYIHNDIFIVEQGHQGKGLGTETFARQVENAAEHGVKYIETHAARGPMYNGYYTWPRLGYDQMIPISPVEMPSQFRRAQKVSDLMRTKAGREWWHTNGISLTHARFDLDEGSQSRQVLDAYRAERARRGDA